MEHSAAESPLPDGGSSRPESLPASGGDELGPGAHHAPRSWRKAGATSAHFSTSKMQKRGFKALAGGKLAGVRGEIGLLYRHQKGPSATRPIRPTRPQYLVQWKGGRTSASKRVTLYARTQSYSYLWAALPRSIVGTMRSTGMVVRLFFIVGPPWARLLPNACILVIHFGWAVIHGV